MESETQRLINLLKVSLKILGVSNRGLARRLEISPSYVSKLFSGSSELRLDHVVRICRAVDLEPAEFFALAYPSPPGPKVSSALAKLRSLLQSLMPGAPTPPPKRPEPPSEERMEEMLKAALAKLFDT